jgi:hypothetical protein
MDRKTYDYGYDNLNRLRAAVSTSSTAKDNLYGENVTYDNMGNITSLGRYDNISGKTHSGASMQRRIKRGVIVTFYSFS